LLSSQDLDNASGLPDDHVENGRVIHHKQDLIRTAGRTFLAGGTHADRVAFDIFCRDNADWLDDYSLFMANLGVIPPEVEGRRKEFGFPGMSLVQFGFGNVPQGPSFRPHNYARELVAYTGGHDNDTTGGCWSSSGAGESTRTAEDIPKERSFARAYLGFDSEPVNWVFIRAVLASVAEIAIVPLQDGLARGSEARMNLPGTVSGNWKWRSPPDSLTKGCYSTFTGLYRAL
jgi:4-alpha-glucanotransferase